MTPARKSLSGHMIDATSAEKGRTLPPTPWVYLEGSITTPVTGNFSDLASAGRRSYDSMLYVGLGEVRHLV